MHHVLLLSIPASEKVPDLIEQFQVHLQRKPTLNIFDWINMHFNPISKHLFSDVNHHKSPEFQQDFSICITGGTIFRFHHIQLLYAKRNIFEGTGKYKFLFMQEFLIPPEC